MFPHPQKITCTDCPASFSTCGNLLRHQRAKHSSKVSLFLLKSNICLLKLCRSFVIRHVYCVQHLCWVIYEQTNKPKKNNKKQNKTTKQQQPQQQINNKTKK